MQHPTRTNRVRYQFKPRRHQPIMVETLSEEEFKRLSPEERLRYLKELEASKREEIEEQRKKLEDQIAEAEELIRETEEEIEEEIRQEESVEEIEEPEESEDDLEERLAGITAPETGEGLYQTGAEYTPATLGEPQQRLYNELQQAATEFERLYEQEQWSHEDTQAYQESKEQVERAQTYRLTNEILEEELGLASGMLKRLQYKR